MGWGWGGGELSPSCEEARSFLSRRTCQGNKDVSLQAANQCAPRREAQLLVNLQSIELKTKKAEIEGGNGSKRESAFSRFTLHFNDFQTKETRSIVLARTTCCLLRYMLTQFTVILTKLLRIAGMRCFFLLKTYSSDPAFPHLGGLGCFSQNGLIFLCSC